MPALLRAAALVILVPILASGCSGEGTTEHRAAREVVTEFFAALESGETNRVAGLLAPDSALDSSVLDGDFFASAIATPSSATIVSTYESDPGVVVVSTDYSIDGEDRNITVIVQESDGQATIGGWTHQTLSIDPLRAPGAWEVNGAIQVGELEESTQFVALPGVYTFEYVDPEGLGTIDPGGEDSASFEVEFPVEADQLAGSVPSGVEARTSAIGAEPRLRDSVEGDAARQLDEWMEECAASGLTGEACPDNLVSKTSRLGGAEPGSVIWSDNSAEHSVPSETWDYVAELSVSFTSIDGARRETATARFSAVITGGSSAVLEPVG